MKYNFNLFHFLILSLLCACKPNLKQPTPESGIIDVSKYIAIGGNRLSRGFTLEGLTINYFLRRHINMASSVLISNKKGDILILRKFRDDTSR